MELAELVGWGVFSLIMGWLGWILIATWKQMESEARESGLLDDRRERDDLN